MYQFRTHFLDSFFHFCWILDHWLRRKSYPLVDKIRTANKPAFVTFPIATVSCDGYIVGAFVQYYTTNLSRTMSTSWQVAPMTSWGVMGTDRLVRCHNVLPMSPVTVVHGSQSSSSTHHPWHDMDKWIPSRPRRYIWDPIQLMLTLKRGEETIVMILVHCMMCRWVCVRCFGLR
jgi:hypothetical protein